jgi:hypothetical protein
MTKNRIVLALFGLVMLAAIAYVLSGFYLVPKDRGPATARPILPSAVPPPSAPMPELPQANIPPPRPLGLPDSAPNRK